MQKHSVGAVIIIRIRIIIVEVLNVGKTWTCSLVKAFWR